jgi:RNA polymerase sigma factor (sigma-70 family)
MDDAQTTRLTLIVRLRNGQDKQAWSDFVDLYSSMVYGFGRRHGLQDADAADLVQEVLCSVARSIRNYDCDKGPFRRWLMAVVRHRLSESWENRRREVPGSGDTRVLRTLDQIPTDHDADRIWEAEYRQSVFQVAAQKIRGEFEDSTWQAFWQSGVEGKNTREVAQVVGISEGAVYIAKSRVLARLRRQVQALED